MNLPKIIRKFQLTPSPQQLDGIMVFTTTMVPGGKFYIEVAIDKVALKYENKFFLIDPADMEQYDAQEIISDLMRIVYEVNYNRFINNHSLN